MIQPGARLGFRDGTAVPACAWHHNQQTERR
jgi:hypothetical protein